MVRESGVPLSHADYDLSGGVSSAFPVPTKGGLAARATVGLAPFAAVSRRRNITGHGKDFGIILRNYLLVIMM